MHSETNERLGISELRADLSPQGTTDYQTKKPFPFGTIPMTTQGDLRTSPRLEPETPQRRRCDGSLVEEQNNGYGNRGWGLQEYPLAMMFAPYQKWRNIYTSEVALERGTLFGELDLPLESANRKRGC